jgi:hypothetical protein
MASPFRVLRNARVRTRVPKKLKTKSSALPRILLEKIPILSGEAGKTRVSAKGGNLAAKQPGGTGTLQQPRPRSAGNLIKPPRGYHHLSENKPKILEGRKRILKTGGI